MFRPYALEATCENWLHDCLGIMLSSIHQAVDAGSTVTWADLIAQLPASDAAKLQRKRSIENGVKKYQKKLSTIRGAASRKRILDAFTDQNKVSALLAGVGDCAQLGALPKAIQDAAKDLFEAAFKLLTSLGVRDRQYRIAFDSLPFPQCPFCWIDTFDDPTLPREDLDHYLAIHKYPFAGANLCNLPPMCQKCNERYKRTEDVLRVNAVRRHSFSLYMLRRDIPAVPRVQVSLMGSKLYAGVRSPPQWMITFLPATKEVDTWQEVFRIRERYVSTVLDHSYLSWLGRFADTCRSFNCWPSNASGLLNAIDMYVGSLKAAGPRDKGFLQLAMFEMIRFECSEGNVQLRDWIFDFACSRTV